MQSNTSSQLTPVAHDCVSRLTLDQRGSCFEGNGADAPLRAHLAVSFTVCGAAGACQFDASNASQEHASSEGHTSWYCCSKLRCSFPIYMNSHSTRWECECQLASLDRAIPPEMEHRAELAPATLDSIGTWQRKGKPIIA